jgi:hypothetical protein
VDVFDGRVSSLFVLLGFLQGVITAR